MLSPFRIHCHRADFVTFWRARAHVEVAEWDHPRGAAVLDLLGHAFACFRGKVAAVELGDRAHDAVHEHAARGLVDVLRDRYELGARPLDRNVDFDVVDTVAGEPVDLVNNDVIAGMVL
nr:hypothetical protein [Mycobacterium sp. 1245852.3]